MGLSQSARLRNQMNSTKFLCVNIFCKANVRLGMDATLLTAKTVRYVLHLSILFKNEEAVHP